ncbi:MAG: hypothetical protein AB8B96_07020 [Lysobacterales bacterium]
MKRNTLTNAVLAGIGGVAGLAGIANAVNLNPDGLGEVLIYPFYTVNGGNDTLLSVVNTTNDVKAVKVRFVDSKNSREVLDFNLYLSPFDVWTGVVTDPQGDDSGLAAVATADRSCTVPSFFAQNDGTLGAGIPYVNFKTIRFDEDETIPGVDVTDQSPERTREGHFEVIEMGIVDEDVDLQDTDLEAAAIHGVDGIPFDCAALVAAWVPGGIWNATGDRGADTDVRTPEGGLFGSASIINVLNGTQVGFNADAIAAFYDPNPADIGAPLTLHALPGSEEPTLRQANTAATSGSNFIVQSTVFDNGRIVTSDWDANLLVESPPGSGTLVPNAGRINAVSAIYMHNNIYNEYAIDSVLNGATEWVMTFPTKRFYVDQIPALAPFTVTYNDEQIADGASCEEIGISFTDREEGDPGQTPGQVNFSPFDPARAQAPQLCYEAQVITFGQEDNTGPSSILGSPNSENISTATVAGTSYENGWATINFTSDTLGRGDHAYTSDDGDTYLGLPVTGFQITVVQNGTLADSAGNSVLSNYAGLFGHRASRSIAGS